MFQQQLAGRWDGCPYVFHRGPERVKDFCKAWHTACVGAGVGQFIGEGKDRTYSGKIFHDLRGTAVRNLIRSGVAQSVAMLISGHKDGRIFSRYNIVDTRDVAEAMQKLSEYEARKRQAREHRTALGNQRLSAGQNVTFSVLGSQTFTNAEDGAESRTLGIAAS